MRQSLVGVQLVDVRTNETCIIETIKQTAKGTLYTVNYGTRFRRYYESRFETFFIMKRNNVIYVDFINKAVLTWSA